MAGFAKASYSVIHTYYRDRYIDCFCTLLAKAAGSFITQLDIKFWGRHKAVVDLLALHVDEVLSPVNIAISPLLCAYKNTHGIVDANLPTPSANPNNNRKVCEAIALINSPP